MEISVNGIKYKVKEQPKKIGRMGSIALSVGLGLFDKFSEQEINIVEEYRLIQEKKSKLSRSLRDWVVYQFNKEYERVN